MTKIAGQSIQSLEKLGQKRGARNKWIDKLGLISATATVEETKPAGGGELNLKGTVINSTTLSIRKLLNWTE
jgi:hypothetical protein